MRNKKGFTLIEIIAVVIIIGILALIIVPSVSSYIVNSRNTAYQAHEKTMAEAAKSMSVETINGKDKFPLPKAGEQATVSLKELVEGEYTNRLEDPATGKLCNEEMSYVIIEGQDVSSYKFIPCLYCGNYVTNNPECDGNPTEVATDIDCGTVTGASTTWTGQPRTITVECVGKGCKQSKFSKTFNTTTKKGTILIKDKKGATKACEVDAYVDKNPPTCVLEVEGDDNIETTGWSSGKNVVIKFVSGSRKDAETGEVAAYGMGTSSKDRDYNKKDSYRIENITGTTTVMGYVKDTAGNEGICYKTVKTGLGKPDFDVRYGYQIYPKKERFNLTNATQSGDNKVKTNAPNASITFTNMSKYTNVTAVIVEVSPGVNDPKKWKLVVGDKSYTADAETANRLKFHIEKEPELDKISSSDTYTIQFGNTTAVNTYTFSRIEIEQNSGNLVSSYQVSVNLITRKEVVKTTAWSWDDGKTYSTSGYYKRMDGPKNDYGKIKNDIPLESDHKPYSLVANDTTGASIVLSKNPDTWTNGNVTITATATDDGTGIVAYAWGTSSSISYYSDLWNYYGSPQSSITETKEVDVNGKHYFFVKDESGNVTSNNINVTNIDKNAPTCNDITGNGNSAIISCSDPAKDTNYGQSKIVKYYFGTKSNPSDSDYTAITEKATYSETKAIDSASTYYLYVKDKAGNTSEVKTDRYFTITFNGNGATTAGSPSGIVRYKAKSISTITNPKREYTVSFDKNGTNATATTTALKATYTLKGWYSDASDGSKVASSATTPALQASVSGYTNSSGEWTKESGATLYAQWNSASITLPSISKDYYTCTWNTNNAGTGTSYAGNTTYTPTSSHTLYGICTPNTVVCDAGYYLKQNETTCSLCTIDNYCPGGRYNLHPPTDVGINPCGDNKASLAGSSSADQCFQRVYEYSYTGSSQTFKAPATGTYLFEVWGGQGGNADGNPGGSGRKQYGGKGGYSKGKKVFNKDDIIYAYVGGKGESNLQSNGWGYKISAGGWNGGASAVDEDNWGAVAAGGGATDFRTGGKGLDKRFIVAGGGGGAIYYVWEVGNYSANGGAGGGEEGETCINPRHGHTSPGGTQSSGCALGSGCTAPTGYNKTGGGGGYYGGRAGDATGGGGGSGYVAGLTEGYTEKGKREGDGFARITWIGA